MYIFGGIFEITKELSELLVYDFETQTFTCIGGESHHETGADGTKVGASEESPTTVKKA